MPSRYIAGAPAEVLELKATAYENFAASYPLSAFQSGTLAGDQLGPCTTLRKLFCVVTQDFIESKIL